MSDKNIRMIPLPDVLEQFAFIRRYIEQSRDGSSEYWLLDQLDAIVLYCQEELTYSDET